MVISRLLNSVVFWAAWIIIPFIMEIAPSIASVFLLLKRHIQKKKTYVKPKVYPEISLIVPVYNSEATLFGCIKSIYDCDYPNDKIRVFLVNNKGRDNSFAVFQKCQEEIPDLHMQWLNAQQGKSKALNMALYNSQGKYIINLDSDGMLQKAALTNLVDKFEANPELNCMTGAILTTPEMIEEFEGFFPKLLRKLEFMEYAQAFLAGRSYASETNGVYTLSGAFSAFRKSAVLKSQMYNTDTICEDTHITFQMKNFYGERVEICEDAIYMVDPIEGVNKLYTQRQRWQRGSLEVAKMFSAKDFSLKNYFKDINIKTLAYDHTFAFPRMIWYVAMIFLLCMNYSTKAILVSTGIIFALYIVIGFLYFISNQYFLKSMPELRKYYLKQWWVVLLLPAFNVITFFIRFAGIVNSINTDSAWKTRDLNDERKAFAGIVKEDAKKVLEVAASIKDAVNDEFEYEKKKSSKRSAVIQGLVTAVTIVLFFLAAFFINKQFGVIDYFKTGITETSVYEDYYVSPNNVKVVNNSEKKNLIYIYVESLEATYAAVKENGIDAENFIPNLTQLANGNISFSNDESFGGFRSIDKTGSTIGGIFATSTGVPYNVGEDEDKMLEQGKFMSSTVSLGDILERDGYTQEFLCGRDSSLDGMKTYFETHGNYKVFDLYTAREEGYIDEKYYKWWGFEDKILYEIAKDEVLRLEQEGTPFNLTMLTSDTHHVDGYECELCEDKYSTKTANVLLCADKQISEFIEWCKEQDFYDDTVIVITGDHQRMDTALVKDVADADRMIYNCFINMDATNWYQYTNNRAFSQFDIFPTVLAALGYEIEGEYLGLGTNLFSGKPTLLEQKGYDWITTELSKDTAFYYDVFAPELE